MASRPWGLSKHRIHKPAGGCGQDEPKIEEFNLTIGVGCAPKIHLIGERMLRKKGRVYMWEAFREAAKDQMMHLKDKHRFKMMHLILKYLEKGTAKAIEIQIQE